MHVSKTQTFRNVLYSFVLKGAVLVCQLAASTIVARNLTAADMGVLGFANIVILFLNHFSDCGVLNAAIRRPQMEQRHLETAFTLKVMLGTGAFFTALLLSPLAWHFCGHPAVGKVTRFLALNFMISTIGFLPLVQLTREMNFKALVVPGVINATVRAVLAITLVLNGWSFWSVVIADVSANLAGNIATQLVRKIPLRFRLEREEAMALLRFGMPLMGAGLLVFFIFNTANLLVSAIIGIEALGYYSLALNWGTFVCVILADTVLNVLFPTFATLQHDTQKLRRWYMKTLDLAAFVAVVGNTALLANAHAFLVTFLGKGTDKWLPALAVLQILCFYGTVRAIAEPIGNCLMVRGHTRTLLRANLLAGAAQIVLLALALRTGKIEWVAASVLIAYASQVFVFIPFLRRELSVTMGHLFVLLWPIVPATAVGWGLTHLLFPGDSGSIFTLALRGLFTAAVVALTHGVLTRFRCFQEAWQLIFERFGGIISSAEQKSN